MVARMSEPKYQANPVFVRALEILFILHADHEQNCSTSAVRAIGSSQVDPFSAIAEIGRASCRERAQCGEDDLPMEKSPDRYSTEGTNNASTSRSRDDARAA